MGLNKIEIEKHIVEHQILRGQMSLDFVPYVGATANVDLGVYGIISGDTPADLYERYNTNDDDFLNVRGNTWYYQVFTIGNSGTNEDFIIDNVRIKCRRVAGLPGLVTVSIRAIVADLPSGGNLCSGSFSSDDITTDVGGEWKTIFMSGALTLQQSTQYALIVNCPTANGTSKTFGWRGDLSTPTYTGGGPGYSSNSGVSWNAQSDAYDLMFEIYGGNLDTFRAGVSTDDYGGLFNKNDNVVELCNIDYAIDATGDMALDGDIAITGLGRFGYGQTYQSVLGDNGTGLAGWFDYESGAVHKQVDLCSSVYSIYAIGDAYFEDEVYTLDYFNTGEGFKIDSTGGTGKILRGNGTAFIASTATYPDTTTAYQLLVSTATNTVGGLAVGTTGKLLRGVTGAVPTWSTATYPDTASTTGAYLRADGTNWITSTLILPNAATTGQIVHATATNTWGANTYFTCSTAGLVTITGTATTDGLAVTGKLTITGISGTTGSSPTGGSSVSLCGGTGGSETDMGTAGSGGSVSLCGGYGGNGANASSSYAGAGGCISLTAGGGGGGTYTSGSCGGVGGCISLNAGSGGSGCGTSGVAWGGCGGCMTLAAGSGGCGSASSSSTGCGGYGGSWCGYAGYGGSATGCTSGSNYGAGGGSVSLYAGYGGSAYSASSSNSGGLGGGNTIYSGSGGSGCGGTTGSGGTGGCMTIYSGSGGGGCNGTSSTCGGSGGALSLYSGSGGCANLAGCSAITGYSGSGGLVSITAGNGGCANGNASYSGSTACGGGGGGLSLTAGTGGNAANAQSNYGGTGGSITLTSGCAGTGSTSTGAVGTITLKAGCNTAMTISSSARTGLQAVTSPTAVLHLPAGTATASTSPLKLTTGTSLTNAEAGSVEYTTDDLFFTIATGTARKRILFADPVGGLTTTRVPFATTNGRLTDDADMTFSGSRLTVTDFTSTNAPIVSSLTSGRVVYVGASSTLVDNSGFTFNGTIMTAPTLVASGADTGQSLIKSGLVVNDDGNGAAGDDFRAETDSEPNALLVDASANSVSTKVVTKIGDGGTTNYTEFETNTGFMEANGSAVAYKDINIAGVLLSKPTSSAPGTDTFRDEAGVDTTIETYAFAEDEKVHGGFELQHDYEEGTDLTFHVHWQGIAAPSGIDNVQWRLNYIVARDGTTLNAAVVFDSPDTAIDTQYKCYRTDFAAITGTTFKIGDQFMFTLTRVAATGDAYAGDALIETAGIHYKVNTLGSRSIATK